MTKTTLIFISIAILFILATQNVIISQTKPIYNEESFAIHPKAGIIGNFYSSDFKNFQGTIDCGEFKSGSGFGFSAFLNAELPLADDLHLGIGLGYTDRSGSLSIDYIFPTFDPNGTLPIQAQSENVLEANMGFFEIHPEIRYVLIPVFITGPLRAVGAFRMAFPISGTFDQNESIVSPDGVYFTYNNMKLQKRNIASGDITTFNSPSIGVSIGFENMLKTGSQSFLTQQILFDYNFTDVVSDAVWKVMGVRFELGLRFSILPSPEPVPEPEKEPVPEPEPEPVIAKTIEPPKPVLNLELQDVNLELLTGNELVATLPLVNSVYFDANSAEIRSYYVDENIEPEQQHKNAIDIHRYVLPRIADIVKRNPKATVTLEGATSGKENEPKGTILSKSRATAVKSLLVKLGIPSEKINIKPRVFPTYPSNQDYEEGILENQRVDILLKNAPLQEYVNLQKYVELDGDIKYDVNFENIPDKQSVNLLADYSDTKQRVGKPGIVTSTVKKRIKDDKSNIEYHTEVRSDDLTKSNDYIIDPTKLNKRQVELNLDNFEAILRFDYDKSFLSKENKNLLKQLTEFLPEGSTIVIFASSDALGTDKRNVQLVKERSDVTEKYLKSIAGNKLKIESNTGFKKYDELTPQGRFLNRSIRIKARQ